MCCYKGNCYFVAKLYAVITSVAICEAFALIQENNIKFVPLTGFRHKVSNMLLIIIFPTVLILWCSVQRPWKLESLTYRKRCILRTVITGMKDMYFSDKEIMSREKEESAVF